MSENEKCIRIVTDIRHIKDCKEDLYAVDLFLSKGSDLFKILSNKDHLKILFVLNKQESVCTCDIKDIMDLSLSETLIQLAYLKDQGIIVEKRVGQTTFWYIHVDLRAIIYSLFDLIV
ncbi:MAG: ArsR family transcriptional regulator [Cyclobacteriaceae bacterium]|nr:ArsR family transcriptional regulator [Cyclobacteriaceae bacterium]